MTQTIKPSKFTAINWIETNDESQGAYDNINNENNHNTKFKSFLIMSDLCIYTDAYILVKKTITVPNTETSDAAANNTSKKIIFKNCAPFINCITQINKTQVNDA